MRTNADLYRFIERLPPTKRPLEEYLRALHAQLTPYAGQPGIALEEFAAALYDALTSAPATIPPTDGGEDWERVLWQQVRDLQQMDAERTLADEWRYFGLDSARGTRWYNFDPLNFLERAGAGAFHGWEPDPDEVEDLSWLEWSRVVEFLRKGQSYE